LYSGGKAAVIVVALCEHPADVFLADDDDDDDDDDGQ
jgi:hypothetical protein